MNLFELSAKIGLDDREYKEGIQEAKTGFGGLVSSVKSGVSNIAKVGGQIVATGAKVAGAAVAAGVAGITALSKLAIDGYADYEQLVGGVETLYGASIQSVEEYAEKHGIALEKAAMVFDDYQEREQTVLANAANAYKTAGLSANEYMETVNGFAASLTSSLGEYEWQAGHYADMIVTDMADNANKMGTSMESIQNAYSGFAKQNYTMLDNLKLGYGGTKEEMERLLRDAEEYAGFIEGSLSIDSFADVADAINIIQGKLGITGTTAKEASSTIAGSISSMKAAWQNLLVGFADPDQDLDALLGNVIDSAVTVANNIGPRIAKLLPRLVSGISGLVKNLGKQIGPLLQQLLPGLLSGAVDLVGGLASELPEILRSLGGAIEAAAPYIMESLGKLLDPLLLKMSGGALDFQTLANGVRNTFEGLFSALQTIWTSIGQPIFDMISGAAQNAIGYIVNNMPQIQQTVSAVFSGIVSIYQGTMQALGDLWESIGKPVWNFISDAVRVVAAYFEERMPQIKETVGNVFADIVEIWENNLKPALAAIGDFIENVLGPAFEWVFNNIIGPVVDNVFSGIVELWNTSLKPALQGILDFLTGVFTLDFEKAFSGLGTFVESIFSGLETAVKGPINNVIEVINKFISGLNQLKIPDFVPGIGGHGVNIPLIPKLYEGGILKKGQIGLLEGAGDEAVVPLHNNKKWITAVANDMQTALSRKQTPSLHIVNNITVNGAQYKDEDALAEVIAEKIQYIAEKEAASYA